MRESDRETKRSDFSRHRRSITPALPFTGREDKSGEGVQAGCQQTGGMGMIGLW